MKRSTEDWLFLLGLIAPAAVWLCVSIYTELLKPLLPFSGRCIWDTLFSIYCPGCGGTRAVEALLKGQLLLSLWYHPVVLYGAALYMAFMISQAIARLTKGRLIRGLKFHNWYLYLAAGIIAVNCILRNILRIFYGITL